MKRWKKIVLAVVLTLAVVITAVCVWQWNNIQAIYLFLTTDGEAIASRVEENRQTHHKAIEEYAKFPIEVAPPTMEQSNQLLDGVANAEAIKDTLGITQKLPQVNQEYEGLSSEELLNMCIAELYACQVDLMAKLGELKQKARDQWNALPENRRTNQRLKRIGFSGLSQCYALEEETDKQVREILDRYRPLMERAGGDPSVINQLWNYYMEEKADEKAYYLNKYLK